MHIDFIFDTVCPWSFVAKRNLDTALRRYPDISFDIGLFPFPLCDTILFPQPSYATAVYVTQKTRDIREKLEPAALKAGISVNFDALPVVTDPSLSYVFIRSAAQFNRGMEALDAVFTAYFCEGRNIGDPDVLCDVSERMGITPQVVKNVTSSLSLPTVDKRPDYFAGFAVRSTPTFIFDAKTLTAGALPSEIIEKMIETALSLENEDVSLK